MPIDFPQSTTPRIYKGQASPLGPLALLAVGVPCGIWWFYSQLSGGSSAAVTFDGTAGCFVILAMAYLGMHGLRNMAWTSISVLLTFEALTGFVAVPVWLFITGAETFDGSYVQAMFLVLVGMAAFWVASVLIMKERGLRFAPSIPYTSSRVLLASIVLLGLGTIGKLVLWRYGLFAYASDSGLRASFSGIIAWVDFTGSLLGFALIVSAVEVLGKRSPERAMKVVFWLSFLFSIGFGIISGMKGQALTPVFDVILIQSLTKRRLPRMAIILPVLLIVVIYPFMGAFRANLNGGYRDQFNTIGGLEETLAQSVNDAFFSFGSTSQGATSQNVQDSTSRISYLTYVRDVASLPVQSMLQADEKLWMAPLYPLVPRFLWKSKPVLNKGQRLSILLGRGGVTSSALTPIGDLYSVYGIYGVAVGMLIWGACVQLYMNWVGGRVTNEKNIFAYMVMLKPLLDLEYDFTGMIAAAVQMAILVAIISYMIYGPTATSEQTSQRLRHSRQAST